MEPVQVLDVSRLSYAQRLVAASLQGLANREGPRLFFGAVPSLVLILSLPLLFWYPITKASHARLRAQLDGKEQ